MNDDLVRVQIGSSDVGPKTAWAEGLEMCLPISMMDAGAASVTTEEVERHRSRAAFTEKPPASSRLPVSYQVVPPLIRSMIGSAVGRWRRRSIDQWARFPRFPVDLSTDYLSDLLGGPPSPFRMPPTPVVLSHDLDSLEGLQHLITRFLDLEESVGARSANYVVPCAWELDHALLSETRDRGHEIGVHGYDHSNRTPFALNEERHRRLSAAQPFIERYRADGYRSPSLLRTRELLADLSRLYRYDSSIPTSGGLFPVPNNGCASARPFVVEGIEEIPLSMPRDGSLLFLGYSPDRILAIWKSCAELISRSGGVVVLLTHCESRFSGSSAMLEVYRRFLEWLAGSDRFEWSSSQAVLLRAQEAR